jgi:K+-sensing histidine kinase KdpD
MNKKDELQNQIERQKILLERERHNFEILFESNIALNSTLNLDVLLQKAMEITVKETMADRGCLMLLNPNGDIDFKVTHNMDDFETELKKNPIVRKMIESVIRSGENSCVFDTFIDSRFKNVVTSGGQNIYSMICLPLTSKDRILGAIYVDSLTSTDSMDFGNRKIQLMEALASQAGVAIENASLYEKTQRQKENIIQQYEITKQLGSVLDFDLLLLEIMDTVISNTRADRGVLMLYDQKRKELDFKIARNSEGETISEEEMKISFDIANAVVEKKTPIRINVYDSDVLDMEKIEELNLKSILCAPLLQKGKILGLIYVDTTKSQNIFDEDSEYFLSTLCGGLAIVIRNAQLYSELKRAHQKLLRLDEMKTKFINIASHELRTPLTAVRGYIYLLKNKLGETDEYGKAIRILDENTLKLVSTINDIINISDLTSQNISFDFNTMDVSELITDVVDHITPITEKRTQTFEYHISPKVGTIIADRKHLEQAINNILNNSIKYTPDGGTIRLTVNKDRKNLYIKISDDGIGIPEDEVDNIFMQFYEIKDTSYHSSGIFEFNTGGLGLGLSIAKAIVEGHGGYIEVNSQENVGSCFSIVLPLKSRKDF